MNDEDKLMACHRQLQNVADDQLSLASVHYLRAHYQQALDTYVDLAARHPDYYGIVFYQAMCHYKLENYTQCLDMLQTYLQRQPESISTLNLKACCEYKMGRPRDALVTLQSIIDEHPDLEKLAIFKHNICLFEGQRIHRVMPTLVHSIPESRSNLVIHYIGQGQYHDAWEAVGDYEPVVSIDFMIKGAAAAVLGQERQDTKLLRYAQSLFSVVGSSPTDQNTIQGRESMASSFFILQEFGDVLMYLDSIAQYCTDEPEFRWNYGLALAAE
ncbi:tetratricopeptide repeat protein 26, partial [Kipferlia bialata]|eukprot:g10577.t1